MLQTMQLVDENATRYPTAIDFLKTFNEEMHSLYLLAFLLTADHDIAEKCLVSAMGECAEGDWCFHGLGAFMEPAGGSQACDPDNHASTEHADKLSLSP